MMTTPNSHLKTALHNAECPVLLVPEQFGSVDNIIITYDGSKGSVFAIKQFASLLTELCTEETLLVFAAEVNRKIPDLNYIKELTARHFPNLVFSKLEIDPDAYFASWVSEQKNTLVVTGSFGRNTVSNWLRHSFVTDVIQEHYLPIFVAHQ